MPKDKTHQFEGFSSPNFTNIPDQFFDELLPDLTGNETKVVLYIMRRTFGFKKMSDDIALSQMVSGIVTKKGAVLDRGTGLRKSSVSDALRTLESKGIVIRKRRMSATRGNLPTTYRLKFKNHPLVRQSDKPLYNGRTPLVRVSDTQQTVIQKTDNTSSKELGGDDEKINILRKQGFSKGIAERFSKTFSLVEIQKQIVYLEFRLQQDPGSIKNRASYLYKAIEDSFPSPQGYKSPEQMAQEDTKRHQNARELEEKVKVADAEKQADIESHRKKIGKQLNLLKSQYGATHDDSRVGESLKEKLESSRISPMLLSYLEFLKLDSEAGNAYFAVEHTFALPKFKEPKMKETFRQILESVTGEVFDPRFVSYVPQDSEGQ